MMLLFIVRSLVIFGFKSARTDCNFEIFDLALTMSLRGPAPQALGRAPTASFVALSQLISSEQMYTLLSVLFG